MLFLHKIFRPTVCRDTLYLDNQTFSAKIEATNLISFIRLISDDSIFDFEQFINQIKQDEELILKCPVPDTNLSTY